MPELLRAASVLRKEVGEQTLVIGAVTGPMTLATQLIGMEDGIYLAADDPDRFEQILDFATEIAIHYGIAQLEAGVPLPMIFDPAASSVIVPPRFFAEFLQPRIKRILTAFHQAGALLHWLMITGTIDPIVKYGAELGLDILLVEYDVAPARILQDLPRTCVAGNFRPLSFVTSTPEKITAEVHALAKLFATRGGLLLSAGCEIPPEAKAENIAALVAAARSHHG